MAPGAPHAARKAWVGLFVRAGTPAPVQAKLEAEALASIQSPAMRARLDALSLEPVGSSGAEFSREFDTQEPVVARMIKATGVTPE
ncbi:hypothetical protein ACIP1U_13940 [Cupriavidus sp. NPDC089707]|uniref:hypothetical protein n=1 Tax=Cupriavidus sp. NPDC089707 TaxID=3363963 RepID=UPI0037FB5BC5